MKGALGSRLLGIRNKTESFGLLVAGTQEELWWAAMAALILSNAVAPTNPTPNSISGASQQRLRTCAPGGVAQCGPRGSWKGVRAAKNGDGDKPSFSLGEQLLDYIEGAVRVMMFILTPLLRLLVLFWFRKIWCILG